MLIQCLLKKKNKLNCDKTGLNPVEQRLEAGARASRRGVVPFSIQRHFVAPGS